MLKGIAVSPGIAIGKVYLLAKRRISSVPNYPVGDEDIPGEIARFEEALIKTREEIVNIQGKIAGELDGGHADIFNAHLLVLEDQMFIKEVIKGLKNEKINIEQIVVRTLKKIADIFPKVGDEYLTERISDINDVGNRVIKNLLGREEKDLSSLKEAVIVVAYDLSPSETAQMHKEKVIGFVTDVGGKTSHTAIMARSLEIPAVVGLQNITRQVKDGDTIVVDGTDGLVIINPTREELESYRQRKESIVLKDKELEKIRELPAVTRDRHQVEVVANIEFPEEMFSARQHGAIGIGLYRTEFFYLNRTDLPSEEEQFQAYRKVAEQFSPNAVTIRTVDLGGDKFVSQFELPREMNPFLGWRGIRFSLGRLDIFKVQLRAILRAGYYGKIKVMFPMISGVDELRRAKEVIEEVKEDLKKDGVPFDKKMKVGVMIETPSAAMTADILAREADFFSIGTNDLIQYALAVDRINERIAYLYHPGHPAIIRFIKETVHAAHHRNIKVGMCGEMAGEPHFAAVLTALGLDELSMSPVAIPGVKKVIRSITLKEGQELLDNVLKLSTGKEIDSFLKQSLPR
ncbi:MAG: phosphoenolpyruvate--protein phosphotransferase [Candidatus Ratteibacteria bacterium]|nr:phosphoenolpyruvate--protein phosphotransferase [Candidatus Ratteibacteria bacterium]